MRYARYIFVLLFVLSYRGLSAQEFDLYDFRYYKRFESAEELLAPKEDSVVVGKFMLDRSFSTHTLDYNLSMVRSSRRGVARYNRATTLNHIAVPYINGSSVRALQLFSRQTADSTTLHITPLLEAHTSAGISFSSRNLPYTLSLATSQPLSNGWSLSANMRASTGRDLHIDGIYGNSLEINGVASKQFENKGTLSVAIFAKPSMRSTRLASTTETFRLTGNNLYNPAWGYQNGKVRSSRVRREFLPTAFIGYEGDLTKRTKLNLSATATIGVERQSALEWFNAKSTAPDNYHYLPSNYSDEEDIFNAVETAWLSNNPQFTQIDFDYLIATNRLNGAEAIYAISDRVRRTIHSAYRGEATTTLGKGDISYGLDLRFTNSRNYKEMRDLLSAEYILDVDYYLLDDEAFGNRLQNNTFTPNRHVKGGDRFGYDYALRERSISAFGTYHYSTNRLSLDVAARVGYASISRRGFYCKELFADNSFGVSQAVKFSPYTLSASVEYLISDNHLLRGRFSTDGRPCDSENLFLQSQYNNRTVDNPRLIASYDASVQYMFQIPNFKLSTTLFVSSDTNETQVRHQYDDLSHQYVDVVINNIDLLRYGLEIEAEYLFADHFRAQAAVCAGRYLYADRPEVTMYTDTSNQQICSHSKSEMKGLSIGNTPQIVATAALSYYNKGWWVNLNANYAGFRYIEPSATIRTKRILTAVASPEQYNELLAQERLKDAFTVDLSASKSLYLNRLSKKIYSTPAAPRFEDRHPRSRLVFRVGVRNLFGLRDIEYSAYESSRLQRERSSISNKYYHQPSRYMYAYPRTFYASATFAF